MKDARRIYTKEDRVLLSGILQGRMEGTNGVPIADRQGKILAQLRIMGIKVERKYLAQTMFYYINNQPVWQASHAIAESERPGLFEELHEKLQTGDPSTVDQVKQLLSVVSKRGKEILQNLNQMSASSIAI